MQEKSRVVVEFAEYTGYTMSTLDPHKLKQHTYLVLYENIKHPREKRRHFSLKRKEIAKVNLYGRISGKY